MVKNNGGVLLRPDEYEKIYKCWNGKGTSCITTRNIPEDKKNCALNKIVGSLDRDILLNAIKDPQEKENTITPEEEYEYRKELIEYIDQNYGWCIPFETLQEKKGDRVKIKRNSQYAYQNSGEGTNLGASSEHGWFDVRFDDGYQNSYTLDDLIIIKSKQENNDEQIKIINENIIQNITRESRNDFLERIAVSIFDASKKDKDILNKMFPSNKFREGDKIIMNKAANKKYNHSKEGSTGVVVRAGSYESNIRFDTIKSRDYGGEPNPRWDIGNEYMINLSKSHDKEIMLDDIIKNISEIVKSLEDQRKENTLDEKKLLTQLLLKENFLLPGDSEGTYVLNYRDMTKFVAPKLYAAYGNKELYNEVDMCAPPSESHPNVLKFELSYGCDYNRCTYCDLYKKVKYCPRTFEQFKAHVDKVIESLEGYEDEIERVFIGSGNALGVEEDTLIKSLDYVNDLINPNRIAMYARTQDINNKGSKSLQKINNAGLTNIYRGVETGSDEILNYVKKGTTLSDMLQASKTLAKTNINLSVTLMPGIGGIRFDKENIKGTIKFLNATDTQYITFMAITPSQNSEYDLLMKEEMLANKNRPLSNVEVVRQVKEILQGLDPKGQKIGMHGPEVHDIDYNPFYFKITFDKSGKRDAIKLCDQYLKTHIL